MLVIISDLHLTDGTSGETIRKGAFGVFRERLRDLAYDASWRSVPGEPERGFYKPIERLDLILLGDILDVIRSTRWPAVDPKDPAWVRPWHVSDKKKRPLFDQKVAEIADAILKQNADSLKVLRSLNDPKGRIMTLPQGTADGKPKTELNDPDAKERVKIDVRVHYMIGNHDWFFRLPGAPFDAIRKQIVDAMGLATPHDQPFPHDPAESAELTALMQAHQVFARHGDVYDQFNYDSELGRNASSLGDAIVVDLLNRFPGEVEKRLGSQLPEEVRQGMKELDNVRPLLRIPIWIDGLLDRPGVEPKVKRQVKAIWNEMADAFLKLDFVKSHDSLYPFDLVDVLQKVLKFSSVLSLGAVSRLLTTFTSVSSPESYHENALKERAFRDRQAHFIVYGHTHYHEIVPLDLYYDAQGQSFDQIYINSGTWRRVHEQARFKLAEREFLNWNVMTYVAFFKGDERRGRPFETWSGALSTER